MIKSLRTRIVLSTVSPNRAVAARLTSQNQTVAARSPKSGLVRPLMIIVAIPKSRHLRGPVSVA